MRQLMAQVERYLGEHQSDPPHQDWLELRGELRIFEAVTALPHNDTDHAIERGRAALATLPDDAHYLRNLAALSVAIAMSAAYRASGDNAAAEEVLVNVSLEHLESYHFLSMVAIHDLAELYQAQGRLREMARHYERLLARLPALTDLPALLVFFVCADYAMLLYEWNRLEEAAAYVDRILQAHDQEDGLDGIFGLILLIRANISIAQRHSSEGLQLTNKFNDMIMDGSVPTVMLDDAAAQRARILLVTGNTAEPLRWARECGLRADAEIPPQVDTAQFVQYTTLARVSIAQASGPADRSLQEALTLLANWREYSTRHGLNGWLIEILAVMSVALDAQGDRTQALATLEQALTLAEPEGYLRTFVNEGAPLAHLLTALAARPHTAEAPSLTYIQQLLALIQGGAAVSPTQPSTAGQALPLGTRPAAGVASLTPREREVLHLLAAGDSNGEIAVKLIITPNTAKRHVKHILGKLGAANRIQALARARALGLI